MEIRQRVTGVIIRDGKILLIRRIKNGNEYYVYPGGGIDEGEDKLTALNREMKEELNFEIKEFEFLFKLDDTYDVRQQIDYTYLIKDFTGDLQLGGPEKEIMNENNQYYPEWIDFEDFKNIADLWPEKIRDKILNLEIWKK